MLDLEDMCFICLDKIRVAFCLEPLVVWLNQQVNGKKLPSGFIISHKFSKFLHHKFCLRNCFPNYKFTVNIINHTFCCTELVIQRAHIKMYC